MRCSRENARKKRKKPYITGFADQQMSVKKPSSSLIRLFFDNKAQNPFVASSGLAFTFLTKYYFLMSFFTLSLLQFFVPMSGLT